MNILREEFKGPLELLIQVYQKIEESQLKGLGFSGIPSDLGRSQRKCMKKAVQPPYTIVCNILSPYSIVLLNCCIAFISIINCKSLNFL